MNRFNNLISVVSIAGLALLGATAHAQYLEDGDMDDLDPGTNPDIGFPAGAWGWPDYYCSADLCEAMSEQFTIVPTNTFDPDATGNSLCMRIQNSQPQDDRHLPNLFTEQIDEEEGMLIVVQFDIWVDDVADSGGGSVYISGDHGGRGYSFLDRSAQMAWWPNGEFTAADGTNGPFLLISDYPRDQWQTVQAVIDLYNDVYTMKWALRGDPLEVVAEDLEFRGGSLDHLDRFTLLHPADVFATSNCCIDNVSVRLETAGPKLTASGDCPGRMQFEVTAASPNEQVAFIYAFGEGSVKIPPGNPCAGTTLGLNASAKLATVERADADGIARFITQVPAQTCGKVYMQAIDLASCATTKVLLVR